MNEPKTVEEAALTYVKGQYVEEEGIEPGTIAGYRHEGFTAGAHWQQSDPDFIADIVRQTLEYVVSAEWEGANTNGIAGLKDRIVNQIIKKK